MQRYTRWGVVVSLVLPFSLFLPSIASADTVGPINFENPPYTIGIIDGQDSWSAFGSAGHGCAIYDEGVVANSSAPVSFGAQSFRISNAVTSGCFSDQAFSKPLTNAAGETGADPGTYSIGTLQPHFESQFDIYAIPGSAGDNMSVSPDRGDGARMSYLRFENPGDGKIHVFFDDVTDPTHAQNGDTFNEEEIAQLDASVLHTIKFSIDFYNGPDNDVVNVYIDGNLVHTGTTWEDYYLYDTESNPGLANEHSRIVRTMLFREGGTAVPANSGKGYLIDNLSLESGPIPATTLGCSTLTLTSSPNTVKGTQTGGYTETTLTGPSMGLDQTQYSFVKNHNIGGLVDALTTQTVIPPWIDPSSDSNFAGSGAVWVSSDPTWPGGNGNTEGNPNNDQWRLFLQGFSLPSDVVVQSADLWYTADNATDVYLNGNTTPLSTTNDVYGPVPGALPQYFSQVFHTTLTPTPGYNQLNFVVRNWGGNFNPNPTGLLYKATINYCTPPSSVSVHIFKYIDSQAATSQNANSASFPMQTTFTSNNLGSATNAPFTLSPTGWGPGDAPYEASFSNSAPGANYATNEVIDNQTVGASCTAGTPFALVGYRTGTTLAAAEAATDSPTAPSFTNLQSDEYVIVDNHACPPPVTYKVHILKYLDGAEATGVSASNYLFPMVSSWSATNIGSGSGSYTLGNNFGGSSHLYGADTSAMTGPYNYTTDEVTNNVDATSKVVPIGGMCVSGDYQLQGYTASASGFDTTLGDITSTVPNFSQVNSDEYVVVWNKTCLPPPPANACINYQAHGTIPNGYTLVTSTTKNANVTLAPQTMFVALSGNNTVSAGAGNHIICTGAGNDTITVGNGQNVIDAGAGNNTVQTGDGDQTVTTLGGNDKITTGAGNDLINAGDGNNAVNSGAGNDTITTGSGNDYINAGPGTDTCNAGLGMNTKISCELP